MREITCFYDTSTKWASKPALLHHLTAPCFSLVHSI